jgi:DNA-directed RNA polymerase subunit beta'
MVRRQLAHADRTYEDLKTKLGGHLQSLFPIEGKRHTLALKEVWVDDKLDPGDWTSQKDARMAGRSWSVPVYGRFELKDLATGTVINRSKIKILDLPRLTNRGSYIVGGSEYMFPLQKRLRSGAYTRTGQDGELRTFFNLAKGANFHLGMHPEKGYFQFQIGSSSNIRLYPLLVALGVSDQKMVNAWGREAWKSNHLSDTRAHAKELKRIAKAMSYGEDAEEDVVKQVKTLFADTEMDGENAALTLGKKFSSVSGDAMLAASKKILDVARGDSKEDNRDSLIHNDITDLSDYTIERFSDFRFRNRIQRALKFNVDKKDKVRDIIIRDTFQRPMDSIMTEADVSRSPSQGNPLGMVGDYTQVTVRGEGGVQSDHALTRSMRALDPSHLGFLDPAHTPEGPNIGTTLHLSLGARKEGKTLMTDVLDVKNKKVVSVTPVRFYQSTVAFPESVDLKTLKLKGTRVKASRKGEVISVPVNEVDYALMLPDHMFDINTSTVPFMSNNNGVRLMMAAKHGVQSKPLVNREAPLVQVMTDSGSTVEEDIGKAFSPTAPVSGTVTKVTKDAIFIGDHKVALPNYFPLNANNFVHAEPKVKVGDKVRRGQVIADTNYTKDGTLAQGSNLVVAYTPYKGMNFEDGVVISDGAAEKLTSEHVYQQPFVYDVDTTLDMKRFQAYFPAKLGADDSKKLDEQGVIKKGQHVQYGDILVAAMRKQAQGTESQRMERVSRILSKEFRDVSMVWPKHVKGVVLDVAKRPNEVVVHVRTEEPMRVGDKLVGRYGNKGVVVHVIPNNEMPKDEKGRVIDVMMNPNGVVSRMNLGQILETTASRIAEKTGKTFKVRGFGENAAERIKKELADNGLKDHETIHDPTENRDIPGVLVGKQYIYKMEHQASKKLSARGGGVDEKYGMDMQPSQGAGVGGRAIGSMEMYSLLAHGAKKNLHEMYTIKSDFDPDVWRAIESGGQIPSAKPTYSQQKFTAMLKGMGVHVDVDEKRAKLVPFLDRQVKELSNGEVTNHQLLRGKDLREEKNGLFDTHKAGGINGDKWTHIKLPEPVPNPTFEKAILSLLGITKPEYVAIVSGEKEVDGKTGGAAISAMLGKIDVKRQLAGDMKKALKAKGSELDKLHRRIRFLRTLDQQGISPGEYVIEHVPVVPPKFRPVYALPDGNLRVSDVNHHYQALLQLREQMSKKKGKPEFAESYQKMQSDLYKAVGGVTGLDEGIVERKNVKGLAKSLGGTGSPKGGYFHSSLMSRRQDVSATAVATVNPKLGLDEIGVPEQLAWKTFRPFMVRELRSMGMTPLEAKKAIKDRAPVARQAMQNVMEEKHVIINRAPTLHKFSTIAMRPRLVGGYAIQTNPFIVNGLNLDYDGDTLALHVPISAAANAEAGKMLPSKHLYKPGSGALQPSLGQEYVLGLFRISNYGDETVVKRFSSTGEVLSLMMNRKLQPSAKISVVGIGSTTPGRVLINSVLPKKHRDYGLVWTKKVITRKLTEIDKDAGRTIFSKVLKDLSDIGRLWAFRSGSSFLLSDLQTMTKQRNDMYRRADIQAERVRLGSGAEDEKRKKIVAIYTKVQNKLVSKIDMKKNDSGGRNNIMDMMNSGARGKSDNVRQLVSNVGVLLNHENKAMAVPVKGTYTEGLDSAEYFQHLYGGRKGMIDKSQSVKDPGAITKQMAVSAAGYRVTMTDCGTRQGIMEDTAGQHAADRYLAEPITGVASRNAMVTTSIINAARAKGIKKIKVRSPLTCAVSSGVCSKCFGLDEEGKPPGIGDHVGIKEVHGITEPTTQLAMRQFHTGGVLTSETSGDFSSFDRAKQLFTMPKTIKDKAILAELNGRVDSVKTSPYGGEIVIIAGKKHRIPRQRKVKVKAGAVVAKGDQLTDGNAQPQDVMRLRGLHAMQMQLRDDILQVYAQGDVHMKAKTVETPIRMLTETVRITDAGDHPSFVTGDHAKSAQVDNWNKSNQSKKPVKYVHVLAGSEQLPHKGDDWAQRMAHNRIRQVLQEAPGMGAESPLQEGTPFGPLVFGRTISDPTTRGLTRG